MVRGMRIAWLPELETNQVALPEGMELSSGVSRLRLHFGAWNQAANVTFIERLDSDTIGLPECWRTLVMIPDSLEYEAYGDGTELHIGPVIAILVSKQKEFAAKLFDEYKDYAAHFARLKGLVYICSIDGIRPSNKTIKGYYYNPQAGGEHAWEKGVFPYPDAGYRRIWVTNSESYNDLIAHTGRRVFNSFFLNKWELWRVLRADSLVRRHLPRTKMLTRLRPLNEMAALYGSVYLKPISSSFGEGIKKAEKLPKGYRFIHQDNTKTILKTQTEAERYIRRLTNGRKYLIQQPIPFSFEKKQVDFRVIMQKDRSESWTCSGIIARFGIDGRFYTNDVSLICKGQKALRMVFRLNREESARLEEEIIGLCTRACQVIERKYGAYGTFGDVGIDIIIDSSKKIWLLEINSRHNHTFASYLNDDRRMYAEVIAKPLEYAKSLAGFTPDKTYWFHA